MARQPCSIDDCDRPSHGRGWCSSHYWKWRKHGDPLGGRRRYSDPEEAFLARTEPLLWSGCLIWTGATTEGYGVLYVGDGNMLAHRYAWEREHGPIPEGMMLDHRYHCDTACCETSHLRLATPLENSRNRGKPQGGVQPMLPRGVHRCGDRYSALVPHEGTSVWLGAHDAPEEAAAAASAGRKKLYGDFAGKDW